MAFGTTETFDSEGDAYRRYPQIVIAFKNQLRKFRQLGIAPIAAAGQFGAPFAANGRRTGDRRHRGRRRPAGRAAPAARTTATSATTTRRTQRRRHQGMALPAILNEVISVTGTYPSRSRPGRTRRRPTRRRGHGQRPRSPGTASGSSTTGGIGQHRPGTGRQRTGGTGTARASDRHGGGTGRQRAPEPAAPTPAPSRRVDRPADQRRQSSTATASSARPTATSRPTSSPRRSTSRPSAATFLNVTSTAGTGIGGGGRRGTTPTTDPNQRNTFTAGGHVARRPREVTGAYALVSSALNYWANLNKTGVTVRRLPDPAGRGHAP